MPGRRQHRDERPVARGWLRGRRALVVGLGRSGRAAARWLLAEGAEVVGNDRLPLDRLDDDARALAGHGVTLAAGGHDQDLFDRAEVIVVSPGIPLDLPPLAAARGRGVPVVSEVDLAAPRIGTRAIGITGSNGKSTTTALAASMLARDGRDVVACGNYGVPLTEAVQADAGERWYAIELSSFQLELTTGLRAGAAVLLNVQADHLDRHHSLDAYRRAKESIATLRTPGAPIVLVVDDPLLAEFAARADEPVLAVSAAGPVERGGWADDAGLHLRLGDATETLATLDEFPLFGRHNRINALAAALAARAVGAKPDAVRDGLLAFRALPHRLEPVGEQVGVRYVDDSKATNVAAAIEAIEALAAEPGGLVVLLGGRDKGGDFTPLAQALQAAGARAVTFGEAGPLIAAALERAGAAAVDRTGPLAEAVERARGLARPGDTVLLAPACASFDEFRSFAHRGDVFAGLVRGHGDGR
jgi:UDP-N-acetylmuramoylalanine--D-glutamate ligase